jgi:hypothetical protein
MPGAKFEAKSSGTVWPDFFEEPAAWRELQEQARSERDPRKLEVIIAEMNRLLSECEKRAAKDTPPVVPGFGGDKKTLSPG